MASPKCMNHATNYNWLEDPNPCTVKDLQPPKEKEMNLYEVAIVKWPTRKESEYGAAGEIILHPRPVLADSDQTAIAKAVSEAGVTLDGSIKVFCRPFV